MPAVSAMKQDTADDDDKAILLDDVHHQQYQSPVSFYQRQYIVNDGTATATPRHDVIDHVQSRDDSSSSRPISGPVTPESAESRQSIVEARPTNKLVNASTSAAAVVVSSPETGWRAISGSGVGGLWEKPIAHTLASSPADAEPADASLVAASPTVGRISRLTADTGSRNCDPLTTLMRLYGTLSDDHLVSSPDRIQPREPNNSPALMTSLPVPPELSGQGGTSVAVNNEDYIMREFNEAEGNEDGPAKSYVCHVCQYIGTSRSMYLNHMSEHFKHRCTLCGYMTSYAGRLKRHLEDCHMTDDERPVNTQRKPTLKRCRKCGFESTNLKLFYDHVRTHIRPERILECPTSSCPFVTEYRHHLELHLRNHLNSRPIRCPICPYRCAVSSMLASHLKSHTKVHRFRCSVCRFSSKFSNALKRHLLEKGHARGYVLNPDGSIPEGGAVPFEPGSPTTRGRQKATTTGKSAAATTAGAGTSESHRKPTGSADATSKVGLLTGADVKAVTWTPPVVPNPELQAAARMASWRPMTASEQLPVKLSPPTLSTLPGAETQAVSVAQLPPLSALMTTSASRGARSLYACALCGFDAGGYVDWAQHMMTSHYSLMTSASAAAATTPFKRRWHGDKTEPAATSWTPPPRLPTPPVRRQDERRDFLPPAFQASSMPMFHRPSPPLALGSYRPLPPVSVAFGSLNTLRAELDAMWSSSVPRTDETRRTSDHDVQPGDNRVKSDVLDAAQWTAAPPPDPTNLRWQRTKPQSDHVEHVSVPVTSGLPLDLSAKFSTPRCEQLPLDSVQSEAKRSRRKGKAFKVDAERLNSGSRDEDLADVDPVVRLSSVNSPWWGSEKQDNTGTGERGRSSGGSTEVRATRGLNWTDDRLLKPPAVSRSEEPGRSSLGCSGSDGTRGQRAAAATSLDGSESSSTTTMPYHECRHCGLGFRDGELFAMHMDFHGRPDPFTCNFCGAATGNQVEFFLHVAHAPHNVRPVYVV